MYRVGVVGAGPGVSALHLPTLAGLRDRFEVVHIADAGSGRARQLAERTGASWSSGPEGILDDPDVDVVALCSPPGEHAAQILAAVAAGKRAVFCEKPLGVSRAEIDAAVGACIDGEVALVVGTNHLFDPSWERVKHRLDATGAAVRSVSITLALAPNGRYHDAASDLLVGPPPASRPPVDPADTHVAGGIVRQLIVGLAVHDLPLVRDVAPELEGVDFARLVSPIGFDIGFRASGIAVRHTAVMLPDGADTLWRVTLVTDQDRVEIDFPPPFVPAGSGRVSVQDAAGRRTAFPPAPMNGYEAEWHALAAMLAGERPMEYDELRADAVYAVSIADQAARLIRDGAAA
ncbi:Gfo/Idh/MocA family oxidoreductase [Microbacterium yannicii]|uniref:Gfo/Idh/MocA family oxidoreductase n=1 Tax=Microbacterium yannicii TaxID=671622 RepID=UPI0002EF99EE|nr:Gfo/Idh/MocA family oxidoreductase [Microbacterium yannicii]